MAIALPFLTSEPYYRLACPIDDEQIYFDVRWNSRDAAWYMDIYEADDTIIALNVKLVTGVRLGRTCRHDFFQTHLLMVVDTTGQNKDPGFDDLGTRVQVVVQNADDLQ